MTMHYLTHRTLHRQKSMDWVSNRVYIHRILQDLVPSDYYLFPNLKRWLCDRRFESNEKVKWETEWYFGGFDKPYYLDSIEKLKDRWTRNELKGEYIEKQNRFFPKKINSCIFYHVNIKQPSKIIIK